MGGEEECLSELGLTLKRHCDDGCCELGIVSSRLVQEKRKRIDLCYEMVYIDV